MSTPRFYWYRIAETMVKHVAGTDPAENSQAERSYRAAINAAINDTLELPAADDRIFAIYATLITNNAGKTELARQQLNTKLIWYVSDFINLTGIKAGWASEDQQKKRGRRASYLKN